ncbi:MAG: sugar-binding domain-containing protein, partial [Limisphaerales bacterium]
MTIQLSKIKLQRFVKSLAAIFIFFGSHCFAAEQNISLAGNWRFALDRADAGIEQQWFARNLPDQIHLPGSLPAQGIGDNITTNTPWTGGIVDRSWFTNSEYAKYRQPPDVKVPFWLQPEKYYKGVAWYQRDFEIPKKWSGQRVVLSLERPHWETSVWLDGHFIGTNDSLATPHEYDFGQLAPGKHTLTIRVDNRMIIDIGENSHAVSDHTQGNWNGIVGKIELRATPPVWVDDVQIYPNVEKKSVRIHAIFHNASGKKVEGKINFFIKSPPGASSILPSSENFNTYATNSVLDEEINLGDTVKTWDEFLPALYKLRINTGSVIDGNDFDDNTETTFGLRDISTDGTQFLINGRKTFFRGMLECCVFPKTGHPPTDVNSWKRIIRIAKSFGLNLIRFHSYCPPEAAFVAADELGMYFQIETCWANQSTTIGDGKPVDAWVYRETARILKAYGNHPSFVLMPYGNEPGGKNATAYLKKYVAHFKALDDRRLWTTASGWPQIPENQFDITPDPRIQHWGEGLKSSINADPPQTTNDYRDYIEKRPVPVISHEIGE